MAAHAQEEQRGQRHGLAPEHARAKAHPEKAGACGNELKFHAMKSVGARRL